MGFVVLDTAKPFAVLEYNRNMAKETSNNSQPLKVNRDAFNDLLGKMIQPAPLKRSDIQIDAKKPAKLIETAR